MATAWYSVAANNSPGVFPWTKYTNVADASGPYTVIDVPSNGGVRVGHSYDKRGCAIMQPWLDSFLK